MPPNSRRSQALFSVAMLLSGFAGISYEILYARVLADIVGDQFAVSAAVLITFLLGIGTGAAVAHRLWRHLWAVEACIGLYGAAIAIAAPSLDTLLYASLPVLPAGLRGSILFCVLVLLVPAFLVGCSIPLFAGYLQRLGEGQAFSRVYAVYNLGAAVTALVIEYFLVRALGIRGALGAMALVNLVVATLLFSAFHEVASQPPTRPTGPRGLPVPPAELVAVVLASVASAIFQLEAVRLAEMLLGPFRETFALVLSLVLGGIALGSVLVRRTGLRLPGVLVLALGGLLLLMAALRPAVFAYAALYPPASSHVFTLGLLRWSLLAVLLGIPATAFGATLPALLGQHRDLARASGTLLFISSLANVAGFLAMTGVLHQRLNYGTQLAVVTSLVGIALAAVAHAQVQRLLAAGMAMAAAWSMLLHVWDEDLLFLGYHSFKSTHELAEHRSMLRGADRFRGAQDVFAIAWQKGSPFLFINGYISIPLNNPSEKMVGAVASLYAPRTDRALVLGLGSGATASAVGKLFDRTDVVEINPVITSNIGRMSPWNLGIEDNPRLRIITDDGIHFMKASRETYSLVLNTVTSPLYFSSAKLYTRDFLRVARSRLAPGGVYMTWLDSRAGDRGVLMVLRTLREVFPACSMLYAKATYFLLMCGETTPRVTDPARAAHDKAIQEDMLSNGLQADWLPYQLLVGNAFRLLRVDDDAPINTTNRPELDFEVARLRAHGVPQVTERVLAALDWEDVVASVGADADPGALVAHAEAWLGKDAAITRKWRRMLSQRFPDFQARYTQARLESARAVAAVQGTPRARYALAARLRDAGKYQEAVRELRTLLDANPTFNNAHYVLGHCLEKMGKLDEAEKAFARELELDPRDEDAAKRLKALRERSPAAEE